MVGCDRSLFVTKVDERHSAMFFNLSPWEIFIMPFAIGFLELAAVLAVGGVAVTAWIAGSPHRRWAVVAFGCLLLATLLSPADLFSMLVMAVTLLAVYFAGTYHRADSKCQPT